MPIRKRSTSPHRPLPLRGDEDLTELAVRAAAGDRAAEAAFVAGTVDDVWRYCAHLLGTAQADDATQATYLRALRSLGNFRGESSAKSWLIGVARNTCLDQRRSLARKHRLRERLDAQPVATAPELDAEHLPLEMEELLAALSEDRREAFVLTQLLGFPYDAAAELVSVPVGTIRSRVARARADLVVLAEGAEAGHVADRSG